MVRRVLEIVYREVRGLHQAAYVLALLAFGSQMLALVRDRLLAHEFGAGIELDLYYAAFRIPDLMYVIFASTLSVYVLIPFVSRYTATGDDVGARRLLGQVFSIFLIIYSVLAATLFFLAPYFVPVIFPGLLAHSEQLTILLQILLLQPLFLGISSLMGVVTQLHHRFVLYAVSPLIYNLGIIAGITVLYPMLGLSGLVWGVVIGAVGHMLIQLPLVQKSNLSFGLVTQFSFSELREVLQTSIPRALTLSLNQFVLLALVSLASMMTVGSVAVFQFAYNLQSVPLAIIGVSYSVAAFPTLSGFWSRAEHDQFRAHILNALRHIIFWSVPAIALVIVLRAQLVRVVLGSGAFNWDDTRLTAAALAILVFSLTAHACNLLIIRAFYAGGYTKIPFYSMFFGSAASILFAVGTLTWYQDSAAFRSFLEAVLRLEGVPGTEVLTIAIGYTVAILVQTFVLCVSAHTTLGLRLRCLTRNVLQALAAALVGGVAAYATINFIVTGINPFTVIGIFIQGLLGGIFGLIGVFLTYYLLGSRELSEIYRSFHSKIFKTKVVAPQEDLL